MTARLPVTPAPAPLEAYCRQFDALFGKANQRERFRRYLEGVLLPQERNKTLTALANTEPVVGASHPQAQGMQWFLSESTWDPDALTAQRLEVLRADPLTAPSAQGVLVIDEHGDRKWGDKTAHVGKQYLANLGKSHAWLHPEGEIGAPEEYARAARWDGPDAPGDWTPVERAFHDGHRETWWALEVQIWLIALHTGMRRGELLGLRWADVDLTRAVLHVRQATVSVAYRPRVAEPKTASGRRTIAFDAVCVSALRQHRAYQAERRLAHGASWHDHDLVFASAVGTPLDGPSISRRFVKLVAAGGVPRIPFHGLRHTHATLLMNAGVHPKVASERLGHASIMLTLQTYSHVLPQMQQEAATIFAEAVGDGVNGEPSDDPGVDPDDVPGKSDAGGLG